MSYLAAMVLTFGRMHEHPAKAALRRSLAIHAYVGANGGGKTLAMIHDTLPSLMSGRPVLSTVRLLDFSDPHPCGARDYDFCDSPDNHESPTGVHQACHPLYVPFTDFRQLTGWVRGDVLMDEVTGVASSRESHAMPVQVVNYLMQLRRRDVLLRWTAPNWARSDKVIREVTQAVTDCSGRSSVAHQDEQGTRTWRDRRFFRWATYDAFEFDEFSTHKRDNAPVLYKQYFWRPGSVTERAYDTLDPVLALGAANDAGMCMSCGGKRSLPRCSCQTGGDAQGSPRGKRRDAGGLPGVVPAGRPSGRSGAVPAALVADGVPG